MKKPSLSAIEDQFNAAVRAEEDGDSTTAAKLYKKIISAHPQNALAYVNLGTILFHRKQFPAAAALYHKAIEVDPSYTMGHFNYANALKEMGQYVEARQAYENAIESDPKHADSHFNLALAYERDDELPKALRHWKAYLQLDNGSHWSAVVRSEIGIIIALTQIQVVAKTETPARTFGPKSPLFLAK